VKSTLLIDGDEYLFKACAAVEREVRWDQWNHVLYCNEGEAWDNFVRLVAQLTERFGTTAVYLCFSGDQPYFRAALLPTYKAGRSRKPLCYTLLRERCDEEYRVVTFPHLEADDVMGLLSTQPGKTGKRIIVSQDKDMKGVPGLLSRDGRTVETISEVDADLFFMTQVLTGDVTDGYPGCPGVGPVKAEKIIQDAINKEAHLAGNATACVWPSVVIAYEKKGLTEADALTQARLARILRWSDWDNQKKEPILWSPSSQ